MKLHRVPVTMRPAHGLDSCCRQRGSRQSAPGRGSCRGGRRVRRLHCGARSCGPSPNSLRSLRSATFKQAATSQFTNALRAGPHALRSSSPLKSPRPGAACRERKRIGSLPETPPTSPQRRARAGGSAPLRRRGAQGFWRRACAHQQLNRRRLFERSERSERSEFGDAPEDRAPQGSRRTRRPLKRSADACPGAPLLSQPLKLPLSRIAPTSEVNT